MDWIWDSEEFEDEHYKQDHEGTEGGNSRVLVHIWRKHEIEKLFLTLAQTYDIDQRMLGSR